MGIRCLVLLTKVVLITILPKPLLSLLLLLYRIFFERYGFSRNIYFLFKRYKEYNGYTNNNNNAERGLRHPEGLYNDEDRNTDEGVLIRIKLKLL